MRNISKIDFQKINSSLESVIDKANQSVLKEYPNATIDDINKIAIISKAVCISALQSYHEELLQLLSEDTHTKDE